MSRHDAWGSVLWLLLLSRWLKSELDAWGASNKGISLPGGSVDMRVSSVFISDGEWCHVMVVNYGWMLPVSW